MTRAAFPTRDLWLAGVVSLGVHATLAGMFAVVRVGGIESVAAALADLEPAVEIEVAAEPAEPIRVGLEKSAADSENWLGAEADNELAAPASGVEQAALSPSPGPAEGEPALPAPLAAGRPQFDPAPLLEAARQALETLADAAADAARQAAMSRPPEPVAEQIVHAPPPVVAAARPSDATGGSPGLPSDKESTAASLQDAPTVVPGRVVAAKGLEISTRRPRFSPATRATATPRNPVVRITFGRDGHVRRAEFVRHEDLVLSTGYADVDEPLINAIYRWTARGEALARVSEDDPNDGVTIIVRVILVG